MKLKLLLTCALLLPAPGRAAASNLGDWLPQLGLVARIGNDFISSYDIAVEVVLNRSLRGQISADAPGHDEMTRAAARLLSRHIVLDAAKRSANVVPDARRMADLERLVLSQYGDTLTRFEDDTGIEATKLRAEIVRRAIADAYVRDVLLPSLRLSGGAYAGGETGPVAGQQLQLLEQLKAELLRLRERFLERQPVEIIDRSYSLEQLLQLEDSLASM